MHINIMPMQRHAKVPSIAAASMLAATDPSTTVQIELAGGGVMTISLAQALEQGLVTHAANGSWAVIPGKATRLRMVAATAAAAVIRPGQPTPPPGLGWCKWCRCRRRSSNFSNSFDSARRGP